MEKRCVKGIIWCHGNPIFDAMTVYPNIDFLIVAIFDAMFTQILTFFSNFLHYLTNYLKQVLILRLKVN